MQPGRGMWMPQCIAACFLPGCLCLITGYLLAGCFTVLSNVTA